SSGDSISDGEPARLAPTRPTAEGLVATTSSAEGPVADSSSAAARIHPGAGEPAASARSEGGAEPRIAHSRRPRHRRCLAERRRAERGDRRGTSTGGGGSARRSAFASAGGPRRSGGAPDSVVRAALGTGSAAGADHDFR